MSRLYSFGFYNLENLFDTVDDPQAKIMIFGDFNSNPEDETLKKHFKTTGYFQNQESYEFYNPMELMRKEGNTRQNTEILGYCMIKCFFQKAFI